MLTPRQRLSRVFILMEHFIRNVAYYRASKNEGGNSITPNHEFWSIVHNNQIDIAVLEWCKLFGEHNGQHGWRRVVADHDAFQEELYRTTNLTADELGETVTHFRAYRDAYVAHLDDGNLMNIPSFDRPIATTKFLFGYLIRVEVPALGMNADAREGFDATFEHHSNRALEEYRRIARARG